MKVTQLCPAFCNPMDCTVHGILQARTLEWVAFPFSRGSSQPTDQTQVSRITGGFFISWATWEAQRKPQARPGELQPKNVVLVNSDGWSEPQLRTSWLEAGLHSPTGEFGGCCFTRCASFDVSVDPVSAQGVCMVSSPSSALPVLYHRTHCLYM